VNGYCMGGGFELSLACRYRVALDDPKTRFAFPEVMLGIMPAWHGVQWLPKLVGPVAAMDLLLTGKAVDAKRAKRMGLVDQAVPQRILENTARMLTLEAPAQRGLGIVQRVLSGPLKFVVVSQAKKQVAKRATREHYPAPYAILDLWQKYDGDPFVNPGDPSCSINMLFDHPTTKNLIRIFFLQEKMKGLAKGVDFKAGHVHIVGAGAMRSGAVSCSVTVIPRMAQTAAMSPPITPAPTMCTCVALKSTPLARPFIFSCRKKMRIRFFVVGWSNSMLMEHDGSPGLTNGSPSYFCHRSRMA